MSKADGVPQFYWDACVFLAGIGGELGRWDTVAQLLDEATAGECSIVTSVATIVEVTFGVGEWDAGTRNEQSEADVDALWHPSSPVKLLEVDSLIAGDARRLIRESHFDASLPKLKTVDAIHLASAMRFGVDEVHTYDGNWNKYAPITDLTVREPWVAQAYLFPASMPQGGTPYKADQ